MAIEFSSIFIVCSTEGCPNIGVEHWSLMRLDEHGCPPWTVCGVCGLDIIPHPHPQTEGPFA